MKDKFPNKIPIFPLGGVIYFPKTNLPLNIFEKRYLDLVNDCIKKDGLMGMVQSKKNSNDVYKVGCLGRISDSQKNVDGRMIINLTGLTRFEIKEELETGKLYREFKVDYQSFEEDTSVEKIIEQNKIDILFQKAKDFFKRNGIILNWREFEKIENTQKINTLSMIAPISNEEKQKLLETVTLNDKIMVLTKIIEFYFYSSATDEKIIQ